jgi:hypothetical protein
MLSGKLSSSSVDPFAKKAAPIFVQLLENEDWKAGGGKTAEEYADLCKGDIACAVVQLLFSGNSGATNCLKDSSLLATLEKHNGTNDRRLRDAVRSALFKLKEATEDPQAAAPGGEAAAETPGGGGKRYDLFLSHKQSDAKDFVRALHTMLSVHGYRCFLDVEFDGELGSLAEIVAQSKQVLFVLTDKVLESPWCLMELSAAVQHDVPVTVIKKEGARWIEPDSGLRSLNFPSYAELNRLPEEIRPLFQIKIVEHSDTYYASFIEKLFERIAPDDGEIADEDLGDGKIRSRQNSKTSIQRVPTKIYEPEIDNDMQVVLDRLQSVEELLKESGGSASNFIIGQVVGALLVIVSIAVLFTLINADSGHRWDAFLSGLLIGVGATAAGSLTLMVYSRGRSAKKIVEPNSSP